MSTILSELSNIFKTAKQRGKEGEEQNHMKSAPEAASAAAPEADPEADPEAAAAAAKRARDEAYRLGREYRKDWNHRDNTNSSEPFNIKLEKKEYSTNMYPEFDERLRKLQAEQKQYRQLQRPPPITVGGKKPRTRRKKPKSHRRKSKTRRKKPKTRRKKH